MAKSKIAVDLTALSTCKLDTAWKILRDELEKILSGSTMICAPSFRDSELYDISSLFVQTSPTMYIPLGKLQDLIDRENTDPFWHTIYGKTIVKKDDDIQPDFQLGLRDSQRRRKVDVHLFGVERRSLPELLPLKHRLSFDLRTAPEMARTDTVYCVHEVIGARELSVSTSDEVNVDLYSIVKWKPILVSFRVYLLDRERKVAGEITQVRSIYNAVRDAWSK